MFYNDFTVAENSNTPRVTNNSQPMCLVANDADSARKMRVVKMRPSAG
jgi:hypothetical protein